MPTLLLTRPQTSAEEFAKAAAWTGEVIISPLIEVVLRPFATPAPDEGLIFTSQHGLRAFAAISDLRNAPVWCVGPGTAALARKLGFATVFQGAGSAEGLIDALRAAPPDCRLVHIRGAHVVTDLAGRLSDAGLTVRSVVGYDQKERPLSDAARKCLQREGPVIVPVFSPRSASLFAKAWSDLPIPRATLYAVAISPAAALGLKDVPLAGLDVAETPDFDGMLAVLAGVQATLEPDRNQR